MTHTTTDIDSVAPADGPTPATPPGENALAAFREGRLKVVGGVSHSGERTLGLCLSSLAAMKGGLADMILASGLRPMCASFNACLDFSCNQDADILFHTASDVVVDSKALVSLLEIMDLSNNYLAVAHGQDPIFGEGTSVGIWIWNMRILRREFRFRDVFKQDLDLCERIETATGKTRVYTPKGLRLGRHHPIWTPEELYSKFVYSYPKHDQRRKNDMRDFLNRGLAVNPSNKALLAGYIGLSRAEMSGLPEGSKDSQNMTELFKKDCGHLHLDGSDYYCDQSDFMNYAMASLGSYKPCVIPNPPEHAATIANRTENENRCSGQVNKESTKMDLEPDRQERPQ